MNPSTSSQCRRGLHLCQPRGQLTRPCDAFVARPCRGKRRRHVERHHQTPRDAANSTLPSVESESTYTNGRGAPHERAQAALEALALVATDGDGGRAARGGAWVCGSGSEGGVGVVVHARSALHRLVSPASLAELSTADAWPRHAAWGILAHAAPRPAGGTADASLRWLARPRPHGVVPSSSSRPK